MAIILRLCVCLSVCGGGGGGVEEVHWAIDQNMGKMILGRNS